MLYFFMIIVLTVTSLIGMDGSSAPLLIKEVIEDKIGPCLTLQEISRLKCTSKEHNKVVDTESFLKNNRYALDHLFNDFPYDFRSKILGHFAITKNSHMFIFLRNKEKDLRNLDIFDLHNFPEDYSKEHLMELCAKIYSSREELQKIRLWQIEQAAQSGSNSTFAEFLKKILPGSGFNIWDITFVSSKKNLSEWQTKQKTKKCRKKIVKAVCASRDADLLLAIMGGIIEPRSLKYVFKYGSRFLIEALCEKDAFIQGVADKHGKAFSFYRFWCMPEHPQSAEAAYQRFLRGK